MKYILILILCVILSHEVISQTVLIQPATAEPDNNVNYDDKMSISKTANASMDSKETNSFSIPSKDKHQVVEATQYTGSADEGGGRLKNSYPDSIYGSILAFRAMETGLKTSITKNYSSQVLDDYVLFQNYPNPFNPSTNIRFNILQNCNVKLTTFNILGKEVNTLVNEKLNAGSYEVDWDGSGYPSGVYFYRLDAGEFVETKKMLLIK